MTKINSADAALTEAELAAIVGGAGYFNEIIAKGMAAQTPKLTNVGSPHADYTIIGRPWP